MPDEDYGDFGSLSEDSSSDSEDPTDVDSEEILDMAIDAALNSCGASTEERREAFKRAVLMVVKEYS